MMNATYSPEDNKLRLYTVARLDAETYARVKAAGFAWAPKQELFVAPAWTPERADMLTELCGEIGDEDTSLVERAEERAERFETYHEGRAEDAERAREAVAELTHRIPMGQPILVGHHSEWHARRDAERIENGMRRAVKMWETAQYWQRRAKGAISAAKYKERPDVRARRIKGLEADERKQAKIRAEAVGLVKVWTNPPKLTRKSDGTEATPRQVAIFIANRDGGYYSPSFTHRSGYVGPLSLWEAAGGNIHDEDPETVAYATVEEIRTQAIRNHEATIARADRWLSHLALRLGYERAMLAESGGTVADKTGPERGGAVKCWASPRGGWSYVQKVNRVSVTVEDNWGNGGRNFTRTIPFDKLAGVMTATEVREAREAGRIVDDPTGAGFMLASTPPPTPPKERAETPAAIEAMRASLRTGVQVVAVPQLFPTPAALAARMVEVAEINSGHDVLEPSGGTGSLLRAIQAKGPASLVAVEIKAHLADVIRSAYRVPTHCKDFLSCNSELGTFDRIVMNPPFKDAADVQHIQHARRFLKPGGRLVALCAAGPRQEAALRPIASTWEVLPDGTFKDEGTGVRVALLTIEA